MKYGAIIVAAGMSSRMNSFKPLLKIGNISVAERTILNFQYAGVRNIVVVTGNQSNILENKLKNRGVIFLYNKDYATTEMFDSAKIGFQYIKDKCDSVFFTPVDIPLFTENTVRTLMKSESEVSIPTYKGKTGHPILLSKEALNKIFQYHGNDGLKGAIEQCTIKKTKIEVEDEGILVDADTPQDYRRILEIHSKQMYGIQVQINLSKENCFFSQEIAQLLRQIQNTGSVRSAAMIMNLSYSKCWSLLNSVEKELGYEIVRRYPGGSDGGNTQVTDRGLQLLERYEHFTGDINNLVQKKFKEFFSGCFEN